VLATLLFAALQERPQVEWPVPAFTLIERSGRAVTPELLRGRVWIANFIFIRCAGPCPAMTQEMRRLQDDLPSSIRLVSFSVDPKRDTPEALREYAEQVKADPRRWWFLTGDKDLIHSVAIDGFKATTRDPDAGSDQFIHSQRFYLVDERGRIRSWYNYDWQDREAAREEMARLREEARALDRSLFRLLPTVNAALNGLSGLFLLLGLAFIKAKKPGAHKAAMLSALAVSVLFLGSYLFYHYHVGSVRFLGEGTIRQVYLGLLLTHTVLAVAILPLIAIALRRAFRGDFERHRRIARIAFPAWLYVSITGVTVYLMLYAL
jgi:protein SCO1/2/putative membrane protein